MSAMGTLGVDVRMPSGITHGVEVWSSASWRALAVSWLDEQLAAAGIERTGEVEQPLPGRTLIREPRRLTPVKVAIYYGEGCELN